jgi:heme-degrading monooxygenase HmoA
VGGAAGGIVGRRCKDDRLRAGMTVSCDIFCIGRSTMLRRPRSPAMILEIADIRIPAGRQAEFDEAILRGIDTVVSKSRGFRGYKVNRSIETPERYVLMIYWDSLDDHTVGFRQSEAFTQWRAIVGPFFAQPPQVEHFELVGMSGGR